MTKYLAVNYSDGKLYEWSKEPKEGFEAHYNTTGIQKGFRKYQDNVVGELVTIDTGENTSIKQKELKLTFKVDSDYVTVSLGLSNSKGNYSEYVTSFIQHIPFLIKGETYTMMFYNFTDRERDRKVIGCSIKNSDGEKVTKLKQRSVFKDGTVYEGEIPEVKFKTLKGESVPDATEQQEYLYEVLEKGKEEFKFVQRNNNTQSAPNNTSKPTPKASPTPPARNSNTSVEDDDDDLPF